MLVKYSTAAVIVALSGFACNAAYACHVVGRKPNGERLCSTTYVDKIKKHGRYDDVNQKQSPAERCRAECIRDALKWRTGEQQAAFFNMCKRNKGCM
jgi:hypothetical protein